MKHLDEEEVRRRLGDKADEKIEAAQRVLREYGDERTRSRLSRTLLGNSVEIIEALAGVAEREPFFREQHGVDGPHHFKGMEAGINRQFRLHMQDLTTRAAYDGEVEYIKANGPFNIAELQINNEEE